MEEYVNKEELKRRGFQRGGDGIYKKLTAWCVVKMRGGCTGSKADFPLLTVKVLGRGLLLITFARGLVLCRRLIPRKSGSTGTENRLRRNMLPQPKTGIAKL